MDESLATKGEKRAVGNVRGGRPMMTCKESVIDERKKRNLNLEDAQNSDRWAVAAHNWLNHITQNRG